MLERDEQGRGAVVEYEVDARFKTVRYRLRQLYDGEPQRLGSEYLGGDFRDLSGEWRFVALGGGPHARSSWTCGSTRAASSPARCAARSPTR